MNEPVVLQGDVADLRAPILHDDRKPLERWLASQLTYAPQEAEMLANRRWSDLQWPDRLRRLYLGPFVMLPYCLVVGEASVTGDTGSGTRWSAPSSKLRWPCACPTADFVPPSPRGTEGRLRAMV